MVLFYGILCHVLFLYFSKGFLFTIQSFKGSPACLFYWLFGGVNHPHRPQEKCLPFSSSQGFPPAAACRGKHKVVRNDHPDGACTTWSSQVISCFSQPPA